MDVPLLIAPSLFIGFLAGLVTFRRKQRWCAECGAMLTCPHLGCEAKQQVEGRQR